MSMDISGMGGAGAPHAMSGASSGSPPQQKMSNLFDAIDTGGSGSITQSQFEQAFQTQNPPAVFQKQGADAIFAALDLNGNGSVSKQDFVSGMSKLMASLRAESATPSIGPSPAETLATGLQALNLIDPTQPAPAPGSLLSLIA